MMVRFVNSAILIITLLLTFSGVYGIVWTLDGWMYEIHRAMGWALIALMPWKAIISLRSLLRGFKPNFDRGLVTALSLILSGTTLFVIALGVMWAWRLGPRELWLRETVISWHWILALGLLPPFFIHAWRRWPKPRRTDLLSRRGFLKLGAVTLFGALGWRLSASLAALREDPDSPRRESGSRLEGYFSGNQFPVTTGAGDGKQEVDLESWRLKVHGAVRRSLSFGYEDLLALSAFDQVAAIDCTIGWYSVQQWRGMRLIDVLEMAGLEPGSWTVRLKAASGYAKSLTLAEAKHILLATHVGGEPLSHWHGFPLRAVVPTSRGWFWVKWLSEIEVLA